MKHIKNILVSFLVFVVIDLLWLGLIAQPIYNKYLGYILKDNALLPVALLFYILFVIGLYIFALLPALKAKSLQRAWQLGGLFGFMTYMTYELTNWAVITDWPWQIVPIDIAWGTFLGASVCFVSYKIITK